MPLTEQERKRRKAAYMKKYRAANLERLSAYSNKYGAAYRKRIREDLLSDCLTGCGNRTGVASGLCEVCRSGVCVECGKPMKRRWIGQKMHDACANREERGIC